LAELVVGKVVSCRGNRHEGTVTVNFELANGTPQAVRLTVPSALELVPLVHQVALQIEQAQASEEAGGSGAQLFPIQSAGVAHLGDKGTALVVDSGLSSQINFLMADNVFDRLAQDVSDALPMMRGSPPGAKH